MNEDGSLSHRLENIYNVVVGATIGFLPSAFLLLAQQTKGVHVPPHTIVLLWVLTTVIIGHEWWLCVNFLREYPVDSKPPPIQIASALLNFAYMGLLLSLPLALVVEDIEHNTLFYYGIVLVSLSLLDIPLTLLQLDFSNLGKEPELWFYIVVDGLIAIMYGGWLRYIRPDKGLLETTVILLIIYAVDVALYECTELAFFVYGKRPVSEAHA